MRVEEVLRKQGRFKSWFLRKMGLYPELGSALWGHPRRWTQEMREKAATILGVTVQELFPPEEEPEEKSKVKLEMRLAGLTQTALAREMGIHSAHLSQMMNGHRRWTRKMKERAAAVLEMPVEELFEESRDGGDGAGRQRALPGL